MSSKQAMPVLSLLSRCPDGQLLALDLYVMPHVRRESVGIEEHLLNAAGMFVSCAEGQQLHGQTLAFQERRGELAGCRLDDEHRRLIVARTHADQRSTGDFGVAVEDRLAHHGEERAAGGSDPVGLAPADPQAPLCSKYPDPPCGAILVALPDLGASGLLGPVEIDCA